MRLKTRSGHGKLNRAAVQYHVNPHPDENTLPILIGTPTLGMVRIEWANAMQGMVSPPNWAVGRATPCGFKVGDAQNMLVNQMLRGNHGGLLLIEDDNIPPPDALLTFDKWYWKMNRKLAPPVVSGLYHIKGSAEVRKGKTGGIKLLGPEPLAYRDSGTRAYRDWKPGDVIWVSGVPTGALLVHRKVFEAWMREPDIETYKIDGYPFPVRRIFQNPADAWIDDEGGRHVSGGTTDLWWSSQTIARGILAKAGWKKFAARRYPYVIDTALRFGHIDRMSGMVY